MHLRVLHHTWFIWEYTARQILLPETRDLRRDLRQKVENNVKLLKSIAISQDELDTEKNVKQLMNLTAQWQEENDNLK